jgi:hypothetical protein
VFGALLWSCCGAYLDDLPVARAARARHSGDSRRHRHDAEGADWGDALSSGEVLWQLRFSTIGTEGRVRTERRGRAARQGRVSCRLELLAQGRVLLVSQRVQEEIAVKMCVLRMVDGRTVYMVECCFGINTSVRR